MEHGGARPVWASLTGRYALFLLVLLLLPFANVAMYNLHTYSPTKVFLPELTFETTAESSTSITFGSLDEHCG
jgi:hypothetical protein